VRGLLPNRHGESPAAGGKRGQDSDAQLAISSTGALAAEPADAVSFHVAGGRSPSPSGPAAGQVTSRDQLELSRAIRGSTARMEAGLQDLQHQVQAMHSELSLKVGVLAASIKSLTTSTALPQSAIPAVSTASPGVAGTPISPITVTSSTTVYTPIQSIGAVPAPARATAVATTAIPFGTAVPIASTTAPPKMATSSLAAPGGPSPAFPAASTVYPGAAIPSTPATVTFSTTPYASTAVAAAAPAPALSTLAVTDSPFTTAIPLTPTTVAAAPAWAAPAPMVAPVVTVAPTLTVAPVLSGAPAASPGVTAIPFVSTTATLSTAPVASTTPVTPTFAPPVAPQVPATTAVLTTVAGNTPLVPTTAIPVPQTTPASIAPTAAPVTTTSMLSIISGQPAVEPPPPKLPPQPVLPPATMPPLSKGDLKKLVGDIDWRDAALSSAPMWSTSPGPPPAGAPAPLPAAAGAQPGVQSPAPAPAAAPGLAPAPAPVYGRDTPQFWRQIIHWDLLHSQRKPSSPLGVAPAAAPGAAPGVAPAVMPALGKCGAELPSGHPTSLGTPEAFCPYCRWCCRCNSNFPDGQCDTSVVNVEDYGGPPGLVSCGTCQRDCGSCPQFAVVPMGHIVQRQAEDITNFTALAELGAGGGCPNGNCCDDSLPQPLPWVPAPAPAQMASPAAAPWPRASPILSGQPWPKE